MSGDDHYNLRLGLHEDFIVSRLGCRIVYHPDNLGFVYFRIANDMLVIQELYVPERNRGKKVAGWLYDQLMEIAKIEKCKAVTAEVVFNTPTAEQALAASLYKGFKVGRLLENSMIVVKEV